MFSRKYTVKEQSCYMEEFISLFETPFLDKEHPTFLKILNSSLLTPYFHDLGTIIDNDNLIILKRYQVLNDGLYILLKGQISFMFLDRVMDKPLTRIKSSNMSKISGTSLINQPLTVFQCSLKNCTTLDQVYLLKISEEQAAASKFYELQNQRLQLFDQHYLAQDHQSLLNPFQNTHIFSVDMKIHSNFSFKQYSFRQKIILNTVGIVSSGSAKLKLVNHQSHQFDKFGLLLPNLSYEVTSADLTLMIVQNNETLNWRLNCSLLSKQARKVKFAGSKTMNNSIYSRKKNSGGTCESIYNRKDEDCRQKQIAKISKESQSYSIISSFLCKKSLQFAKKQNQNSRSKQKKQTRYKNPLILFNIVNQKTKLATPSFSDLTNTPNSRPHTNYIHSNKQTLQNENNNLNILRKIKLAPQDYSRMVRKHKSKHLQQSSRPDGKAKSMFTFNLGRDVCDYLTEQQQSFVPYGQH